MTADTADVAIIGAGIVGLATAMHLLETRPDLSVTVLDKEPAVGRHQTGHNSGVIHAGVYYAAGSLKARLCREGRAKLLAFLDANGIAWKQCGKLLVALDDAEVPRLLALKERSAANGLQGVVELGPDEMTQFEPNATGKRALWVPETGITDFAEVADAFARTVTARGGTILTGAELQTATLRSDGWALRTPAGELHAKGLIGCAGLHADRVARLTGVESPIQIVPFRGDYYTLSPQTADLVRGLLYPAPDPSLPFLGVHFTRRLDGQVWAGPNAVLAMAREGYRRRDVRPRDLAEMARFPGLWGVAKTHWRTGIPEMYRDFVKPAFVTQLRRYLPQLSAKDLTWGPSGVRAQAVDRKGNLVDDFSIMTAPRAVHVLNAPSPAATSSMAIGAQVATDALAALQL